MYWITYSYLPGFAEDLTNWKVTITAKGKLQQTVRIARPSNSFSGETLILKSTLTPNEIAELAALAAATDFHAVATMNTAIIEDVEKITITVPTNDITKSATATRGPWLWMNKPGGIRNIDHIPAPKFLQTLEQLCPWTHHPSNSAAEQSLP